MLAVWGGYPDDLWFSEALLIEMPVSRPGNKPIPFRTVADVAASGGRIVARFPATSEGIGHPFALSVDSNKVYITATMLKDGTIDSIETVDKVVFEELAMQREYIQAQRNLFWVTVLAFVVIAAIWLRGQKLKRKASLDEA